MTVPNVDLDGATVPEFQARMDRGALTAIDLVEAYLERIGTLDGRVRSVLVVHPRCRQQAEASDDRRRRGGRRGPLDGIPVLLKDNIDTADLPTTAGSRALRGAPPAADAAVVRRLRDAGAIVVGKANLSEWANFRSTSAISGWSAVGGQTSNPHALDRSPGGSSSGPAAAVAAALTQVAIGTETEGSILIPSGMNGVVGMRPSRGSVSRAGVVPISLERDTPGPIARHVVDAAITLSVLWGPDPADPATSGAAQVDAGALVPDEPEAVLTGARIGLCAAAVLGREVEDVMDGVATSLRAAGAHVVPTELPDQDLVAALQLDALLAEFRRDITRYLRGRPGGPDTLAELVEHNRRDPAETSRFAGQELLERAMAAPGTDSPAYRAVRDRLSALATASMDHALVRQRLDVIAAPTNPPAWRTGIDERTIAATAPSPAAIAGHPAVTVPAGFVGALPVGVTFTAGRWADATALAVAAAFEQATRARRAPRFLASSQPFCGRDVSPGREIPSTEPDSQGRC